MAWSREAIDARTDEILVDAYNDSEQLGSFECVLDELIDRPVPCRVGQPATLVRILMAGHAPVLQGVIEINGQRHRVDLLELDLAFAEADLRLGVAAYEHWARGR